VAKDRKESRAVEARRVQDLVGSAEIEGKVVLGPLDFARTSPNTRFIRYLTAPSPAHLRRHSPLRWTPCGHHCPLVLIMVSHAFGAAMVKTTSLRLTKRIADASAARGDRYHLWDVALPGCGLRVEKSGTKTFIVRYRADASGRSAPRRFITIGRFGTLTVDQARRAKSLLGAPAVGEDPAAERNAERREQTVSALADPSPSKSRDAAWSRATQASQGGRATGTLHERLPAGVLS
jgi:hypothetical protein